MEFLLPEFLKLIPTGNTYMPDERVLSAEDKERIFPVAFCFSVKFHGFRGDDTSFKELSGISTELVTEELTEGGENSFVHRLPTGRKQGKLVLKRGIGKIETPLVSWCKKIFEGNFSETIETMPIDVSILNSESEPECTWTFSNAFPVSWEIEEFQSTKNEIAIEKIEFSYTELIRE